MATEAPKPEAGGEGGGAGGVMLIIGIIILLNLLVWARNGGISKIHVNPNNFLLVPQPTVSVPNLGAPEAPQNSAPKDTTTTN